MDSAIFSVGDEPFCLWEVDLRKRALDFLGGLDPEFFTYLLDAYEDPKDEQAEKRASVAIRLALHHATETMFALLGAFVQAPYCPHAWIAQYRTEELRNVVRRMGHGDPSLPIGWKLPLHGWKEISALVHRHLEPGSERNARVVEGFARTWTGLAGELLDDAVNLEYNAIKHGFRTRSGGFRLAVGPEDIYGVAPPESAMVTIADSKHGSMFYQIQRHKGKGGRHLTSRRMSLNWSLKRDKLLLDLAQFSINNIVSALKVENGVAADTCSMHFPEDDDYGKPWSYSTGLTALHGFDVEVDPATLPNVPKAELLRRVKRNSRGGAGE